MILSPHMTAAMTEQGLLSPDGKCKTFDANANGYARGEGIVTIHIKKLCDAIQDNDPIRAIIRSSCLNSDGRTSGLSHPSSESHEALIRRSHTLAGFSDFSKTAMIECHGTGTQVGDPLEATAIGNVFGDYGIYIGSVSIYLAIFSLFARAKSIRSNPTLVILREHLVSPALSK